MSFKCALLLALAVAATTATVTFPDMASRASTAQCCSSVISASSLDAVPILASLGITVPGSGKIGVGCMPITTSGCANNCDGGAVSCSQVSPSVLGIDIGISCTPLPPCSPPCNTIGTNTSQLYGGNIGNAFNDLDSLIGTGRVTTDNVPSIRGITLRYGRVIDGLAVTYSQGTGQTLTTISHGTSLTATGPANTTVTLNGNETIISVSGVSGVSSPFGERVLQLKFLILDSSTGKMRDQGPFGTAPGTAFNVTGNGSLITMAGFANNTNTNLAGLKGAPGGLYGLSFITSTGLNCTV